MASDNERPGNAPQEAPGRTPPLNNAAPIPLEECDPRTPCNHKPGKKGRNLIVCIDGTANKFGEANTNVIELYNLILKDGDGQRTFYNSGIGTYAQPHWLSWHYCKEVVFHTIDMAIAWDFDKILLAAYRWLADNYEEGDTIFLFGFSRGAFQVRVLSAMIAKVGLIYKGNEMQIPFAYQLYADPKSGEKKVAPVGSTNDQKTPGPHETPTESQTNNSWFPWFGAGTSGKDVPGNKGTSATAAQESVSMAERFKRAFSRDVRVHFVGAWDTVSSVGITKGRDTFPGATEGMTHVCFFRHALALDECRVKFLPEYAWGGSAWPDSKVQDSKVQDSKVQDSKVQDSKVQDSKVQDSKVQDSKVQDAKVQDSKVQDAKVQDSKVQDAKVQDSKVQDAKVQDSKVQDSKVQDSKIIKPDAYTRSWHGERPHTLEVWFAGTHSDIGGGNEQNMNMDRSRPPLRWMALEAATAGLKIQGFKSELPSKEMIHFKESLHGFWHLFEWLPFPRLTYEDSPDSPKLTRWPHRGSGRRVLEGQKIHSSLVLAETTDEYLPKAVVPNKGQSFWKDLRQGSLLTNKHLLELDLFDNPTARRTMRMFLSEETPKIRECVNEILTKQHGAQALYEEVVATILGWNDGKTSVPVEEKYRILQRSMGILLPPSHKLSLESIPRIRHSLADLRESGRDDHRKVADEFLKNLADSTKSFELPGHTKSVWTVAFSPDSKSIISGSDDTTIRIWSAVTGAQIGKPLEGHTQGLCSVAMSHDSKRIVSSAVDWTIRIWDVENGQEVVRPLEEHRNVVRRIVISPDGKHIVSGSYDKTMRVWNMEDGSQAVEKPLQGHTDGVESVAFLPDGKHIVSGSDDGTIGIWDAKTGEPVGQPLRGHTDWIMSIAVSPDGKLIVSGSNDRTIRIWDVETRRQVGELREHTDMVRCVAISPNGKYIVSCSSDKTIRIWDLKDRKQVVKLEGHTDRVLWVAISPDGKSIVSGSADQTVRIWNGEWILD